MKLKIYSVLRIPTIDRITIVKWKWEHSRWSPLFLTCKLDLIMKWKKMCAASVWMQLQMSQTLLLFFFSRSETLAFQNGRNTRYCSKWCAVYGVWCGIDGRFEAIYIYSSVFYSRHQFSSTSITSGNIKVFRLVSTIN